MPSVFSESDPFSLSLSLSLPLSVYVCVCVCVCVSLFSLYLTIYRALSLLPSLPLFKLAYRMSQRVPDLDINTCVALPFNFSAVLAHATLTQ